MKINQKLFLIFLSAKPLPVFAPRLLCDPNNPTGPAFSRAVLAVIKKHRAADVKKYSTDGAKCSHGLGRPSADPVKPMQVIQVSTEDRKIEAIDRFLDSNHLPLGKPSHLEVLLSMLVKNPNPIEAESIQFWKNTFQVLSEVRNYLTDLEAMLRNKSSLVSYSSFIQRGADLARCLSMLKNDLDDEENSLIDTDNPILKHLERLVPLYLSFLQSVRPTEHGERCARARRGITAGKVGGTLPKPSVSLWQY
jgi:hypothetical protein